MVLVANFTVNQDQTRTGARELENSHTKSDRSG